MASSRRATDLCCNKSVASMVLRLDHLPRPQPHKNRERAAAVLVESGQPAGAAYRIERGGTGRMALNAKLTSAVANIGLYLSGVSERPLPGILLLHEIFGVNHAMEI